MFTPSIAVPAGSLTALVDTRQGTDSTFAFSKGNTLPLVAWPNGMTAWTPQTEESHWIFNYRSPTLQGFRATHQPSPWMGDYGHFLITPSAGQRPADAVADNAAPYAADETIAQPHYFRTRLTGSDILAELTATERCAVLRFRFAPGAAAWITLRPARGRAGLADGTRRSLAGVCTAHRGQPMPAFGCHFVVELGGEAVTTAPCLTDCADLELLGAGQSGGLHVRVAPDAAGRVELRVGTSFISRAQAALNLRTEVGSRSFEEVRARAMAAWEERLGVVQVEGPEHARRTFYRCLYRCHLFPRLWHESDAQSRTVHFSPFTGRVEPGVFYTDLGLWDAYRAHLPLLALLHPDLLRDILNGWLNATRAGGWLPGWISPGHRTCMIGAHAPVAFADAFAKGIGGVDYAAAFAAARREAHEEPPAPGLGRTGIRWYAELGYVPCDLLPHATARTLDYALGDFALAQLARRLGHAADAEFFARRALNYRKLFDPATGFMRGRRRDGSWQTPFSEFAWSADYIEGGPWQHTWTAPHDPAGLAECFGGPAALAAKLDAMLAAPPAFELGGYPHEIHEMTEMAAAGFGQYAHSNEPVQHALYLYAAAGRPDRLQHWVSRVVRTMYGPGPGDGFPGDEDNGAMSAWFVFSALGFFPLCPGHDSYVLGTPLFPRATLALGGRTLRIEAPGVTPARVYVRTVSVDGRPHPAAEIAHSTLRTGGTLCFEMSETPAPLPPGWTPPFSLSTAGPDFHHNPASAPSDEARRIP